MTGGRSNVSVVGVFRGQLKLTLSGAGGCLSREKQVINKGRPSQTKRKPWTFAGSELMELYTISSRRDQGCQLELPRPRLLLRHAANGLTASDNGLRDQALKTMMSIRYPCKTTIPSTSHPVRLSAIYWIRGPPSRPGVASTPVYRPSCRPDPAVQ
jgi:hypothetical protein